MFVDLCDWQKFEDALYKALCRWSKDKECQCEEHDDTRWQVEDCDGTYQETIDSWLGNTNAFVNGRSSADSLMAQAVAALSSAGLTVNPRGQLLTPPGG